MRPNNMRLSCYLYAVLIKTTSYLVDESSLNFIIKRLQNVCKAILSTVYLQRDNMSLHGELKKDGLDAATWPISEPENVQKM